MVATRHAFRGLSSLGSSFVFYATVCIRGLSSYRSPCSICVHVPSRLKFATAARTSTQ